MKGWTNLNFLLPAAVAGVSEGSLSGPNAAELDPLLDLAVGQPVGGDEVGTGVGGGQRSGQGGGQRQQKQAAQHHH